MSKLERYKELRKMMTTPGQRAFQRGQVERLVAIVRKWNETGQEPVEVGPLSSGEYCTVCLATRNYDRLPDPLVAFLELDEHLQRLVLNELGLGWMIGLELGGEAEGSAGKAN